MLIEFPNARHFYFVAMSGVNIVYQLHVLFIPFFLFVFISYAYISNM